METICDQCSEKNKTRIAEKYCSNCEEKLCTKCAQWHLCSSNVSESKDEFLTSFEAESKGKTDSQDLWLSGIQAQIHLYFPIR
jgi:hypothetical protein